jgi:NOL1/NOP2/sun family putative RNA methylase
MSDTMERLGRYRDLVGEWGEFADACARPLPVVVWENPFRRHLIEQLAPDGGGLEGLLTGRGYRLEPIDWHPGAWRVEGLDKPGFTLEFQLGMMHVQEEVSLAPPLVLDAQPGERVLDLCAAPGGKTVGISVRMNNLGTLVANDIRPHRLRALRSTCERLGALNVVVTPIDGTRYPLEAGPFDRILLDVPCSCEGNVRDTPTAAGRGSGVLEGRSGLQATLLGRAWKLLRPGGVLVYATCTFAPEENEVVLDYVLGEDARVVPFEIPGLRADPGVDYWGGKALREDVRNLARFWPHLNDTGGFTIARIEKVAS